jgi:hypothetical protein
MVGRGDGLAPPLSPYLHRYVTWSYCNAAVALSLQVGLCTPQLCTCGTSLRMALAPPPYREGRGPIVCMSILPRG